MDERSVANVNRFVQRSQLIASSLGVGMNGFTLALKGETREMGQRCSY
jgi:hypothetical protein